ncbi:hypothetical protein JHN49_06210 [Streptomyces sp. MBT57]|nr:hypothetical protein [Streptomyces sp. MBT57]
MTEPHFDWFEELTPERRLERQVLQLVAAHDGGLEAQRLGKLLERTHRNAWEPVYDTTWDLARRGLIEVSPKPDDSEVKPCTYMMTSAGHELADEIREQARARGRCWRQQQPDLPQIEEIDNTEGRGERTVTWHFHNLVTASGSLPFATWTRGEHFVRLWTPEAAFRDVLAWRPRRLVSSDSVQELAGAWGPVGRRIGRHRIFPAPDV